MKRTVHIIGAGMSGLAAAVALARKGYAPTVYEAGPQAGGRCRSYFDKELDAKIDNGNHLLLSGNPHVMRYLKTIGARDTLEGPPTPIFPFIDLATNERWELRPSRGKLPLWLFDETRRVPGTVPKDYLEPLKLARARPEDTVADILDTSSTLYRRLWDPLSISALNTQSHEGSARLFWRIIRETLGAGGKACLPLVPKEGLSESLVDPAIAYIEAKGGKVLLQHRVARVGFHGSVARAIDIAGGEAISIAPEMPIVLAVPAPVALSFIPALIAPTEHCAIVNLHYRYDLPPRMPPFIGIVGGMAEWVFIKPGILSVTISAADHLADIPSESIAETVWGELCRIYRLESEELPPYRVVREKRATFAAIPSQLNLRPGPETRWSNLYLAGDWTDTGLPSTIEGSVKSGHTAVRSVLKNT